RPIKFCAALEFSDPPSRGGWEGRGAGLFTQPFLAGSCAGALREGCGEPVEEGEGGGFAVRSWLGEGEGRVHDDEAGAGHAGGVGGHHMEFEGERLRRAFGGEAFEEGAGDG